MRYFIFYPPSKSLRLIDVTEDETVENTLISIKEEFDLKVYDSGSSDKAVVLNYNGCDLKPKWSFGDLNIPSGAIIRCVTRQQTAADLYIHCGFNKQILKIFDSSITIETTIGTIRKKISEKIGLPLSTFCLETYDGKQRLYDHMKLMTYDIKIHDHVYLKVWQGYEKFINSCVKGFTEHFSHDDLIRHYQAQVALHIAAFYGHLDLARSVMEQGARSDRSAGEHPSRQWSIETSTQTLPEMRKCPIHIAIERGHIKMVDIFVRTSILCTQIRDPTTNYLPYQLANSYVLSAITKEERQRYSEIYFYLKDKQFNLKIPLNGNGEYVTKLLSSSTSVSNKSIFALGAFFGHISLSLYCKIISWYERAREKVWKRTGGSFLTGPPAKRVYPATGLLGYKVLIDGYNNKYEVPVEQLRGPRHSGTNKSDHSDRYVGFSTEERDKIIKMKAYVKQFALDERKRAKQIAAARLQSRRTPTSLPQALNSSKKNPTRTTSHATEAVLSSSSEFNGGLYLSSFTAVDTKLQKPVGETDTSSITSLLQSTIINPNRSTVSHESKEKVKTTSKSSSQGTLTSSDTHEETKHALPIIAPTTAITTNTLSNNKLEASTQANTQFFQPIMSSVDAYILSSSRLAFDTEQNKLAKKNEIYKQTEQLLQQDQSQQQSKESIRTGPIHRAPMLDLDYHIPLPEHPNNTSVGPIQSRIDLEIRQSTIQSYERYSSASTRSTAIECLEEAAFFKRKTWIKKVEISKEMIKHKVQQRMRRAVDETNKRPMVAACHSAMTKPTHNSNSVKVK